LINAMAALDDLKLEEINDDIKTGINIVRKSLEVPMERIAENAGYDGPVVVANVRAAQSKEGNKRIGFDVLEEKYVDMVDGGVIDPVKVTRGALENATSIAAMILTTEALVTDIPEEEKPVPAPPPSYDY